MLRMNISSEAIEILKERQNSELFNWQVTMYDFSWWQPPKFGVAPLEQREDQDIIFQFDEVKLSVTEEIAALVKEISIIYTEPKIEVKVQYKS